MRPTTLPPVSNDPAVLRVPDRLGGERLDRAVAALVPGLSRAQARKLIDAGQVTVNGVAHKASTTVRAGDTVGVDHSPADPPSAPKPEAIPLDVVHEDDALLVLNKPAGLVVHPAPGHAGGTLVNAVLHHTGGAITSVGDAARPGIVHRLDRDTTGLLVVAKTAAVHTALAAQFAAHDITREYLALVWGTFAETGGTIEAPIGRSVADRKRMAIPGVRSRAARTHFTVAAAFPGASEMRLRLDTGRTHQVRVHCGYIGHGVIGDPTYGTPPSQRSVPWPDAVWRRLADLPGQMLHATVLGLTHPVTGAALRWEAPPPPVYADLRAALAALNVE